MKAILILFTSLILAGSSFMVVSAEESQADSEQGIAEKSAIEMTDTDSSTDRSADAKSLFEGRCQMCHQLPEPGMLRPKQWKLILATMQQRMQQAGVPPLTGEETAMILEYIAQQSR
jgi:cytochrome c5